MHRNVFRILLFFFALFTFVQAFSADEKSKTTQPLTKSQIITNILSKESAGISVSLCSINSNNKNSFFYVHYTTCSDEDKLNKNDSLRQKYWRTIDHVELYKLITEQNPKKWEQVLALESDVHTTRFCKPEFLFMRLANKNTFRNIFRVTVEYDGSAHDIEEKIFVLSDNNEFKPVIFTTAFDTFKKAIKKDEFLRRGETHVFDYNAGILLYQFPLYRKGDSSTNPTAGIIEGEYQLVSSPNDSENYKIIPASFTKRVAYVGEYGDSTDGAPEDRMIVSELNKIESKSDLSNEESLRCTQLKYKLADNELNRVYQQLINKVKKQPYPQSQKIGWETALRQSQRNWIKFRDSDAVANGFYWFGANNSARFKNICLQRLTKERIGQLRRMLRDYE